MTYKKLGVLLLGLAICLTSFFWQPPQAEACTRALWRSTGKDLGLNSTQPYAICGRNMDWGNDMKEKLFVFPRGLKRSSNAKWVPNNGIDWVSKYGSVSTVTYDQGTSDGMNEKGLAVHALWLSQSNYGKRDPNRPGIDADRMLQYFLDNFATVKAHIPHDKL